MWLFAANGLIRLLVVARAPRHGLLRLRPTRPRQPAVIIAGCEDRALKARTCLSIVRNGLPVTVVGVEHDGFDDATHRAGSAEDLARDSMLLRIEARRIRHDVQRTREILHQRRHRQDPRLLRPPCPDLGDDDCDHSASR